MLPLKWLLAANGDTKSFAESIRKLPRTVDRLEVELSGTITSGGCDEEDTIYGDPDCLDPEIG
ncbi:MAG: hypothetical protein ACOY4M_11270, partial [Pseudomonadota bacterium]